MTAATLDLPLPDVVHRNEHLSVSRLRRYEQCALAFYHQYVARTGQPLDAPDREPAEFGTTLHAALESAYRWVVETEYEGRFPEGELLEAFRAAWAGSGLVGAGLYQEGRDLLRQYADGAGHVDHMRVLAVEREFHLLVGPGSARLIDAGEKGRWRDSDDHYVVNGYIDRVDRVDGGTVEVVDYKSNRLLYSREELADDLQLSVYAMVARELYPWASRVDLSFQMLRHGTRQRAERSGDDLAAAREYVRALGARSERGPYPPKLNAHCGTCEWRGRCDTYRAAVSEKLAAVAVDKDDLDAVARERERVHAIAKAAYARKEQLDGVLRAAVERAGSDAVEYGGITYRLAQYFDTEYPVAEVAELLRQAGVDIAPALRVDGPALKDLVDRAEASEEVPRSVRDFLRVRVAAKSVKIAQKPRLDARPRKKP